jgi:hypothetical protein
MVMVAKAERSSSDHDVRAVLGKLAITERFLANTAKPRLRLHHYVHHAQA